MASSFDQQANKKAYEINVDPKIYGVFAEIGAGQEVARRFFSVSRAAGTVAKTISAYDMSFSDAIYGACGRYVSRVRSREHVGARIRPHRGTSRSEGGSRTHVLRLRRYRGGAQFRLREESPGWMGIRFQAEPRAPVNDIIIHVRMLDEHNLQQQEALGIVGVNLIHSAFHLAHDPNAIIGALLDDLDPGRIEVDMIRFSGPKFVKVDNRIMALQLVAQGLTKAALFPRGWRGGECRRRLLQEAASRRAR